MDEADEASLGCSFADYLPTLSYPLITYATSVLFPVRLLAATFLLTAPREISSELLLQPILEWPCSAQWEKVRVDQTPGHKTNAVLSVLQLLIVGFAPTFGE